MFLVTIILITQFISVEAAGGTYTLDNDGEARSNPIGDSGLPSSFLNAKYYDCYVPYNLSPKEIGGYATKVNWCEVSWMNEGTIMKEPALSKDMGAYINYQSDYNWSYGGEKSYEQETGAVIVTDSNNTKYYVCAIQNFFYSASVVGTDGFCGWGSVNRGQIFDIILTDGTVLHFLVGDAGALQHTNGGDYTGKEKPFEVGWSYADMKLKQYHNLFGASAGHMVELWGKNASSASKLASKYNIGSGEGQNKIAYYRMYNKKVSDAPEPQPYASNVLSYNIGVAGVNNVDGTGSIPKASSSLYAESYFVDKPLVQENTLILANYDNLMQRDKESLTAWREDLEFAERQKDRDIIRAIISFIGILLTVYYVLLYLAYQFDSINNILDVQLLQVLSLNRFCISTEDISTYNQSGTRTKQVVHRDMVIISVSGVLLGVLILSGKFYSIVASIVSVFY